MIKTVTVHDAQTQLLKLLSFAMKGNEVIITKDSKPLVRLVPISLTSQPRKAGLNKGKIWVSDDFDVELPDEFWMGSK